MNIVYAIVVLGVLGALFGLVLSVASKIFEVKKDPREEAILSHLAGANCGGCGFPGCKGMADALVKTMNLSALYCPVGGAGTMQE